MFTNFDNYSSTNIKINVSFRLSNGIKGSVVVYNDVLVKDSIDKFFWNNQIIDYNSDELEFIFNGQKLNKNNMLSEIRGINNISIIDVIIPLKFKG